MPDVLTFHETDGQVRKREDIASGRRHVTDAISYSEGWAACTCGFEAQADLRILYLNDRHRDLAAKLDAHIAAANRRRPRAIDEDDE